jgi:hypothetical protein
LSNQEDFKMLPRSKISLKQQIEIVISIIFVGFLCHSESRTAKGLPMFARRYGVPCSTCHTSPPRLNETGYQFRAAGFRMPEELGKNIEIKHKLTDHIGFRLQPRYDARRSCEGSEVETKQKINLFAAEGYLWYGPVSKYFSSSLKITVWPEESNETELTERLEGTIRFNYGRADHFIDLRAGVPHPMEGFGGSESYVICNTKPFIQDLRTANFNQDTFFTPLGFHQTGGTMGYHYKRTTIRGHLLSGLRLKADDDGRLEPFGRKEPFSKALAPSNKGGPDFQLYFNQILHHDGGNVSLYYYKGQSYLPRLDLLNQANAFSASPRAPDTRSTIQLHSADDILPARSVTSRGITPASQVNATDLPTTLENLPFFKNNFHRLAFYAGYPVKRVNLLYGIQHGRDTIGMGGHFSSLGQFAEASIKMVNDISAVGVRYDWLDPARSKDHNEMKGITAYVNVWLHNELRITPEYQHLVFKQQALQPIHRDDAFQLRLYWVR